MNAVEIEEAVSALVEQAFDAAEFPHAFLQAFGRNETTIRRLRVGDTNKSDIGGVLQKGHIHIAVAPSGQVSETLTALRDSPATARHKARFILATDGNNVEAEELGSGEPLACEWNRLADYFGFFLALAGISTVREIRENAFDIRATSKLNKLYIALLRENPEWGTDDRRPEMNHFMARLIFSFFAEDTGIFAESGLFTRIVTQMSAVDASNTHEVIGTLFTAMNTKHGDRDRAGLPRWAISLPYVNGGLFSGSMAVPRFSRSARSYLLQVGSLDWRQINPDIFGSMIQAVAEDEERGALGMHYTSVPNILKVLNPLFLDDLRAKLDEARDNARTLLNLRKRIARIRVFDPACGSGNFLVIAYKEMRAIEDEINRRRGEMGRRSEVPLTNFRGIELRDFAAEIARLALIIAEYQADVTYRGQTEALADFLPLSAENWITRGNALRIDWLAVCPPTGTDVKLVGDDLFSKPLDQSEVDFENVGGETYICGNPPYLGSTWQSPDQKDDLRAIFGARITSWKSLDYVAGWFMKAAEYGAHGVATTALVATNSICQGQQVPILWPLLFGTGARILFAYASFKWANLASHNAGVTVVIVGMGRETRSQKLLFSPVSQDGFSSRSVSNINAYLIGGPDIEVGAVSTVPEDRAKMEWGNKPTDGGHLILNYSGRQALMTHEPKAAALLRRYVGSQELVGGSPRWCLWITDEHRAEAEALPLVRERIEKVRRHRADSSSADTRPTASFPYRFRQIQGIARQSQILLSGVSSENRDYLPVAVADARTIASNKAFALYDAPLWNMALIASRLHWVWIGTVCVRLEMRFSYSNTLGWNTFPVPTLTEQNKAGLTTAAEEILLAREAHYPATIADLYDPKKMPDNLREAHERNDELLERIYIGRRFRNDTERLEKLFEMYTKMTVNELRPVPVRRERT